MNHLVHKNTEGSSSFFSKLKRMKKTIATKPTNPAKTIMAAAT